MAFRDAHLHFITHGRPADENDLKRIEGALKCSGILEVYDMGDRAMTGLKAKEVFGDSLSVKTCGCGLYKKGGYGRFIGIEVDSRDEIIRAIRELFLRGVDFIKVINSGIVSLKPTTPVTEGGFSREELKIICSEAGEIGLDVFAHANSDRSIREAVEAGVISIEHGFFITKDTLDMMKENSVSWTPTVFAFHVAMSSEPHDTSLVERIIDGHLRSINYAASIGLRLKIGTDSGSKGVRHGESYMKEVEFFRRAGLSPQQINAAAGLESTSPEQLL